MSTQEQYVVDAQGKRTGVLVPLAKYQKLMEDLHDLAIVAERRKEKPITLDQLTRQLKRNDSL